MLAEKCTLEILWREKTFLEIKEISWIVAATTGRFYDWVDVVLGKRPMDVSHGNLSLIVAHKD